jgi:hypothetical protein
MKNIININWNKALTVMTIIGVSACASENIGPTLKDSSSFTSPVITNPATASSAVLKITDATKNFETFAWNATQYGGLHLSTNYSLQIDTSSTFKKPKQILLTSATSADVTVDQFNSAVLGLGAGGDNVQAKVYLRLRSTIDSYPKDTLYSNSIARTVTTYVSSQCGTYCTIGIIGDATPGSWNTDTDMHLADPTRADKHTWTVTLYLTQASAKFRSSDDWAINWGASDFPSGTGAQNGANIPISAAGYYNVTFNDQTGAYSFTALTAPTFTQVSLIGDATAGGWSTDTDMTLSSPHIWTATVTLGAGSVKFRANHDWTTNWGSTTFPSGYGVGGGPNISIATGNSFFVWFNDVTGEYYFGATANAAPYATGVSLIGPAASDWSTDVTLTTNPNNSYLFSKIVTLVDGDTKFRHTNDWNVNWGGSTFPGGLGIQGGPNIPAKAGKYFVTINSLTGEYLFLK